MTIGPAATNLPFVLNRIRNRAGGALAVAALVLSCASQRVTAPLDGEPVCADFEIGAARTRFKGALRRPVKVTVLDGRSVVSERIVLGKRTAADPESMLMVEDDDETYRVVFAQCQNPFAPHAVEAEQARQTDGRTVYTCGDAKPYKEIPLAVKEGVASSRRIMWQAPPEPACHESRVPPAEPAASASASAGGAAAPSAPSPTPAAGPSATRSAAPSATARAGGG